MDMIYMNKYYIKIFTEFLIKKQNENKNSIEINERFEKAIYNIKNKAPRTLGPEKCYKFIFIELEIIQRIKINEELIYFLYKTTSEYKRNEENDKQNKDILNDVLFKNLQDKIISNPIEYTNEDETTDQNELLKDYRELNKNI